jgi:hypothetical protein
MVHLATSGKTWHSVLLRSPFSFAVDDMKLNFVYSLLFTCGVFYMCIFRLHSTPFCSVHNHMYMYFVLFSESHVKVRFLFPVFGYNNS